MNYKELEANRDYVLKYGADKATNKASVVAILEHLMAQQRATDERTKEYKKSVQDTIDNQRKALEEREEQIEHLEKKVKRQHDTNRSLVKENNELKECHKIDRYGIDEFVKERKELNAEIDMLKQSNEKYTENYNKQNKNIQDAHEANKRLVEERNQARGWEDTWREKALEKAEQCGVLKRANDELVKDIKTLEDRNKTFDELNTIVKKHKGLMALVDNFSYSE